MKRRRFRYSAFIMGLLVFLIAGWCGLWLQAQQRQYLLNRQLIAALTVTKDDRQALALVNGGADSNTRYTAPPKPSFRQLWNQVVHHSVLPVNDSPTAFLIACGAAWKHDPEREGLPEDRPEDVRLVQAMLLHGANVNVRDKHHNTALILTTWSDEVDTVAVLLAHGADVNAQDDLGSTALLYAINSSQIKRNVRQLLAHGANPNLLDNEGDNALSLAQRQVHLFTNGDPDVIALLIQHGATHKPPAPPTSVPAIARLLGVKVGYNGQDRLEHLFGKGVRSIGGHPNGTETWCIRQGVIVTDGFSYNEEGEALEDVEWHQQSQRDRSIPLVHALPHQAGWLGLVYPGMTMAQVSQLTTGRVAAPQIQGNTWTWTARGFVRPSAVNYDVYTTWTAQLTFQNGVLDSIDVQCDGGRLAP